MTATIINEKVTLEYACLSNQSGTIEFRLEFFKQNVGYSESNEIGRGVRVFDPYSFTRDVKVSAETSPFNVYGGGETKDSPSNVLAKSWMI